MYLIQVREFNEASSIMQKLVDNGKYSSRCSPKEDSLCGIRKETWDKYTNQIFEIEDYYPYSFTIVGYGEGGFAFPSVCLKVLCEENEEELERINTNET